MPRELVAVAAGTPVLRDYEDQTLQRGEIRVQTEFGAPKHGTEMHFYHGDLMDAQYDPALEMFMPVLDDGTRFPFRLGNIAVGRVVEVTEGVDGVGVGDRVAGYGPLRERQVWDWTATGTYPGCAACRSA